MASSCTSRWKQWWKRSPNTCCSKKILLLLVWQMMNAFSCDIFGQLTQTELHKPNITPFLFQLLFAPFIGWLADVKFGRYEILKFASIILSFFGSILFYMALISESGSTLSTVLYSTARVVITFGGTCFLAAMVPFLTQLIGASSQELSAAVLTLANNVYLSQELSAAVQNYSHINDLIIRRTNIYIVCDKPIPKAHAQIYHWLL